MRSLARASLSALILSLRLRFVDAFAILAWTFFPMVFAALGLFVLNRPGVTETQLAYGVLGGGLVGYWGVTYIDAGNGIQSERWNGTLEQIFALPTPLWAIVLGKTCGGLLWGMLSFLPTLALAFLGFHAFLPHVDAIRLVVSFAVLTLGFFAIAFVLTPLFALWRWAFSMLNGFELGVYVLCGFMFPVTLLPSWVQVISALLPPAWATRVIYASTTSEGSHDFALWWALSLALTIAYLVAAHYLYALVQRRGRVTGELALA